MFKRIVTAIWGEFDSGQEIKKFFRLALIFGLIIGIYWAMRPAKDSIFKTIVGGQWLWAAKIISIMLIAPLVVLYSKLIDSLKSHKVFYGLLGAYAVSTLLFVYAFNHPVIGLANTDASPYRIIGWLWYVFVESFGSLTISLFWVITTSITLPDSARRGFPVIAFCGQFGNVVGPAFLNVVSLGWCFDRCGLNSGRWAGLVENGMLTTSSPILMILAVLMVVVVFLMYRFMCTTPQGLLMGYQEKKSSNPKSAKKKEAGFLEGLRLLLSESYLLGIFVIVALYEIMITLIDYHFKQTVYMTHAGAPKHLQESLINADLSSYAIWVGVIAMGCILLGINQIQKYLGIRVALIMLPPFVMTAMILIAVYPFSITVPFWIMVISKAVNYALNQPTLKQLYIPTTHDARLKTQGWIEMFGSRSSKGLASVCNGLRGIMQLQTFLGIASVLSFGFIGIWVAVALFVSKKYNTAIENNETVC